MTGVGDRKISCRILLGKPEGKGPFLRPNYRSKDNFKMDLEEAGWGDTDWIDLFLDTDR